MGDVTINEGEVIITSSPQRGEVGRGALCLQRDSFLYFSPSRIGCERLRGDGPQYPDPFSLQRKGNDGRENGFTLIEILVVTLILSVLTGLAFFSMGLYLRTWSGRSLGDTRSLQDYRAQMLVRYSLESVWEYFVTDKANEQLSAFYPFFQGDSQGMTGVVTSSVFHKGVPAVFRFKLIDDTASSRILVYEEAPLDNWYLRYVNDSIDFTYSMIFLTQISEIHFRYYGLWEILPSLENEDIPQMVYRWQDIFDGKERGAIPEIIELTFRTNESNRTMLFHVRADNRGKISLYFRHE